MPREKFFLSIRSHLQGRSLCQGVKMVCGQEVNLKYGNNFHSSRSHPIWIIHRSNIFLSSRWLPLPHLMIIVGENTRFNTTSYVTFNPNDSIIVIGQIGFGNLMIAMVLVSPNTEESLVDVSATTMSGNGEIVTFIKENTFDINLLPFNLNEGSHR